MSLLSAHCVKETSRALDLGIKNSLINNFNTLELRADKGEILENFVCNLLQRLDKKPKFWNLDNKSEIDFVLKNQKAIEVKWSSRLRDKHFKARKYFKDFTLLTRNLEGKLTKPVSLFLFNMAALP